MATWKKILLGATAAIALGVSLLGLHYYRRVAASRPRLEGTVRLEGLSAPVRVERDGDGVAFLRGRSRDDVGRALGFVHAQERFFHMDLMRRRAAGELAELLGEAALELDRSHRLHRMRARAREVVSRLSEAERRILSSYTDGINAGLAGLSDIPFEYLLLDATPVPWTEEDSVLVVYSMFFELNDPWGRRESALGLMRDRLPAELASFLEPRGTEWDAPLVGEAFSPPPVPAIDVVASAAVSPGSAAREANDLAEAAGSNNWALAGWRTKHGGALLASDMHLSHSVPNLWFRAALAWDGRERIVGVTLPGVPFLVAGSNGDVAWGFTNSAGDWVDLVEIEPDPTSPERYRTQEGFVSFDVHRETIEVRGAPSETLVVRETIWGPVIDEDHRGVSRASRWIAHEPEAVNMHLRRLEEATSVEEAIPIAQASGLPPQNFVVADQTGAIAWTIAGRIPRRVGFEGRAPRSWASGERGWRGWLEPEDYPVVSNPPSGSIWTANARVVEGEDLVKIGDGGYALGARARQIRDALRAFEPGEADEASMLAIQLDDRALFLSRWRDLFLEVLDEESELAKRPALAEARRWIDEGWTGRASIDSVGYRLVKEVRLAVFESVYGTLTAPLREADPRFRIWHLRQWEAPLWRLVTERPASFVPPPHATWSEAILESLERVIARPNAPPLAERTWGGANRSSIAHPLSRGAPFLSPWLDMPSRPLRGDRDMPRVQSPSHGASQRLVVSPGREEEGLFHMPAGQSGHPVSPYYGAGHEAWEEGRPTPLLLGDVVYELTLVPAGAE